MYTIKHLILSRAETVKRVMGKFFAVSVIITLSGAMVNTASATMIVGNCALTTITDAPAVEVSSDCQPRPAPDPAMLISIDYTLTFTYDGYLEFANLGTQEGTVPAGTASIRITADDGNSLLVDRFSSFAIEAATLLPDTAFRAFFDGTLTATGSIDPLDFIWLPGEPFTINAQFSDFFGITDEIGDCTSPNPESCILLNDALMTVSLEGALTYTYEDTTNPVPAPAPLALFSIGLAVLGFLRHKKR